MQRANRNNIPLEPDIWPVGGGFRAIPRANLHAQRPAQNTRPQARKPAQRVVVINQNRDQRKALTIFALIILSIIIITFIIRGINSGSGQSSSPAATPSSYRSSSRSSAYGSSRSSQDSLKDKYVRQINKAIDAIDRFLEGK